MTTTKAGLIVPSLDTEMEMAKRATEIFSIFGQIEAAAAEVMIERHGCHKIDAQDIPPTASVNEQGQRAKFAIVVPAAKIGAFNKLIRDLRA